MTKEIEEMTIKELEQEHEEGKSITQKIVEQELRKFYISTELLRRYKNLLDKQND